MTQTEAILTSLWKLWREHPPRVPPDGKRLFYRYVDLDEPSWDDWNLIGVWTYAGIKWLDSEQLGRPFREYVQEQIEKGINHEVQETGDGGGLEWGLFHGDGPEGQRVEDWAGDGAE